MKLNLTNRVVVVTGGASGIGKACAESFLAEKASVAIWDISCTSADVSPTDHRLRLPVDVTSAEQVLQALSQTEQHLGPVDHLVHAAAIGSGQFGMPFTRISAENWRRVLDVNVMGMVHVAQAVSPSMVSRRTGTMVYVASVAGQIGSPTDPPYSASKAANINFAQIIAKDLAPHGIRVNTVCPGMVKTPLNQSVWQAWCDQQPEAARMSYDQWAEEKIRQLVPLGTWQAPQDIADMVLFLSSERACQVTGQTINVDGGYVMHW